MVGHRRNHDIMTSEEDGNIFMSIPRGTTIEQLRVEYIEQILKLNKHNRTKTAIELGINYTTLMAMIKRGYIKTKPLRVWRYKDDESD